VAAQQQSGLANPAFIQTCAVMVMLANGFIFAARLWGGAAALLIDRAIRSAAALLIAAGVLSFFGFMHSVLPTGGVYLPWTMGSLYPYHWAIAYFSLAALLLVLGRTRAFSESPPFPVAQ
jgi:AGZA family xanthine/uracil permease-like MFS transporter